MPLVNLSDGRQVNFPDSMGADQIRETLRKHYPPTTVPAQPPQTPAPTEQAGPPSPPPEAPGLMSEIPKMAAMGVGGFAGSALGGGPTPTGIAGGMLGASLGGAGYDWLADHLWRSGVPKEKLDNTVGYIMGNVPTTVDQAGQVAGNFGASSLANMGTNAAVTGLTHSPTLGRVAGGLAGGVAGGVSDYFTGQGDLSENVGRNLLNTAIGAGVEKAVPAAKYGYRVATGKEGLGQEAVRAADEAKKLSDTAVRKESVTQQQQQEKLTGQVKEFQEEGLKAHHEAEQQIDTTIAKQREKLAEQHSTPVAQAELKERIRPQWDEVRLAKNEDPEITPEGVALPPERAADLRIDNRQAIRGPAKKMQEYLSTQYENKYGKDTTEIPTEGINAKLQQITDAMLEYSYYPENRAVAQLARDVGIATRGGVEEPVRNRQQGPAGIRPPWMPREVGPTEEPLGKGTTAYDPNSPWAQDPGWKPGDPQGPLTAGQAFGLSDLNTTAQTLFGIASKAKGIMRDYGDRLSGSDRWMLGRLTEAVQDTLNEHIPPDPKLSKTYAEFKAHAGSDIVYSKKFQEESQTAIAPELFDAAKAGTPLRPKLFFDNASPTERKQLTAMAAEYLTAHPEKLKGQADFYAPLFERMYGKGHPLADPNHFLFQEKAVQNLDDLMQSSTPAGTALRQKFTDVTNEIQAKVGDTFIKNTLKYLKGIDPFFAKELEAKLARAGTPKDRINEALRAIGQPDLETLVQERLQKTFRPEEEVRKSAIAKANPETDVMKHGTALGEGERIPLPAAETPEDVATRSVQQGKTAKSDAHTSQFTFADKAVGTLAAVGATAALMGHPLSAWHTGLLAMGVGSRLVIRPLRAWQRRSLQDPVKARAFAQAMLNPTRPDTLNSILRMSAFSSIADFLEQDNAEPINIKVDLKGPLVPDTPRDDRRSEAERLSTEALTQSGVNISGGLRDGRFTSEDTRALLQHMAA